ncbi:MAG: acyl-CoA dehydrogenase family protein [Nocardioidaceae bacterium]
MASSTTETPEIAPAGPEAAARVRALLPSLAAGELDRERTGTPPYDEVKAIAAAGFGLLRLPAALGGPDLTITELIGLVVDLGAADPSVAHLWRNHFLFTELLRTAPDVYARWLPDLRAGALFGLGFGEAAMPRAGTSDFDTRLVRDGAEWVLTGVKHYSTGNLYARHIVVHASLPDARLAQAVVPRDRAGVEVRDDWDGFGQRFTGSGTTVFAGVRLTEAEVVLPEVLQARLPERSSPFAQVWLTAVLAGICARASATAVEVVRGRQRNYFHGLAEEPRHDPLLQSEVGRLSAGAFAARAVVLEAARSLDAALAAGTETALEAASLDAARAKVVVDDLATTTTAGLLDTGGASAVRRGVALDRHWRNARTLIAHNPASYKRRVLGDHLLNGTPPPRGSFF